MSGIMFGDTFIPTSSAQNLTILGEFDSISFYSSPTDYINSLRKLLCILIDSDYYSEISKIATALEHASKFYTDVFCYCVEQCKSDPDNAGINMLLLLEEFDNYTKFPEISGE
mgnify:CR=1 FL=1